jgi:hypothetical protein
MVRAQAEPDSRPRPNLPPRNLACPPDGRPGPDGSSPVVTSAAKAPPDGTSQPGEWPPCHRKSEPAPRDRATRVRPEPAPNTGRRLAHHDDGSPSSPGRFTKSPASSLHVRPARDRGARHALNKLQAVGIGEHRRCVPGLTWN